ncbi:MAG: hypothetical protein IKD75_01480 [Prevotella sp.]|nr:hypothetical protein [Prevotella sp.]
MKANDIIQQGTDAKYAISISGFNMAADAFDVTLSWGMSGGMTAIRKQDMIQGADGRWYFKFPTSGIIGFVTAECRYNVPDSDYAGGIRMECDRQTLCFVAVTPNPHLLCCPPDAGGAVTYERTMDGNIGDYDLLTDRNGLLLRTADGKYLAVLKGIINK